MAEYTTKSRVNLAQLTQALHGLPVTGQGARPDEDGETTYRVDGISDDALKAAVDSLEFNEHEGMAPEHVALARLSAKAQDVQSGKAKFTAAERDEALTALLLATHRPLPSTAPAAS